MVVGVGVRRLLSVVVAVIELDVDGVGDLLLGESDDDFCCLFILSACSCACLVASDWMLDVSGFSDSDVFGGVTI